MMKYLMFILDQLNWVVIIILCLTLGLAPFAPPHILEKISMLMQGTLIRPLDWFDLLFHSLPWLLLIMKLVFRK